MTSFREFYETSQFTPKVIMLRSKTLRYHWARHQPEVQLGTFDVLCSRIFVRRHFAMKRAWKVLIKPRTADDQVFLDKFLGSFPCSCVRGTSFFFQQFSLTSLIVRVYSWTSFPWLKASHRRPSFPWQVLFARVYDINWHVFLDKFYLLVCTT